MKKRCTHVPQKSCYWPRHSVQKHIAKFIISNFCLILFVSKLYSTSISKYRKTVKKFSTFGTLIQVELGYMYHMLLVHDQIYIDALRYEI